MRPEDLNDMLRSESESVEWKRSLGEWKEIVVATAAMASLHGGRICIGVEPTGKVCGVELGKGTLEDLANKIAQGTSPRVIPSISSVRRDQIAIVIVSVPESTAKPVYAFDRPYRRAGKTNQRLSQEEAMRLFMSSRGGYLGPVYPHRRNSGGRHRPRACSPLPPCRPKRTPLGSP